MDVPPKWISYHKKILRRGSHFTKILKKIVKSVVFDAGKPLKMVPISENLEKMLNQPFLDREKSIGKGFQISGCTPCQKNNSSTPLPELNSP